MSERTPRKLKTRVSRQKMHHRETKIQGATGSDVT